MARQSLAARVAEWAIPPMGEARRRGKGRKISAGLIGEPNSPQSRKSSCPDALSSAKVFENKRKKGASSNSALLGLPKEMVRRREPLASSCRRLNSVGGTACGNGLPLFAGIRMCAFEPAIFDDIAAVSLSRPGYTQAAPLRYKAAGFCRRTTLKVS